MNERVIVLRVGEHGEGVVYQESLTDAELGAAVRSLLARWAGAPVTVSSREVLTQEEMDTVWEVIDIRHPPGPTASEPQP